MIALGAARAVTRRSAVARRALASKPTPQPPQPTQKQQQQQQQQQQQAVPAVQTPKPAAGVTGAEAAQAPNRESTWSLSQNPRGAAMTGPRFEQTDIAKQPRPLAAIELIAQEPVRVVESRTIWCDGGGGPLGHPRVYLNLDNSEPVPCGYCGIRFQQKPHHH